MVAIDLFDCYIPRFPCPYTTYMYIMIINSLYLQPFTNTTVDNHDYYNSTFYHPGPTADSLWINLTDVTGVEDLVHNISDRYRVFDVSMQTVIISLP